MTEDINERFAPSGTVTLVFTDIERYSTLYEQYRATFQEVVDQHNVILRQLLGTYHGYEVSNPGDGFFFSFEIPSDAIRFSHDVVTAIAATDWKVRRANPADEFDAVPIAVRIGIHTGEVGMMKVPAGSWDYYGAEVNRAARVGAAAHGGQVLVSNATYALTGKNLAGGLFYRDAGEHRLKGVGDEHLWQLCAPDLSSDFPAPATLAGSRHNIPIPQTPLIGRATELKLLTELLCDKTRQIRILSLVGMSGLGKTRLAQQVGELCYDSFKDGVWWISLEQVRTEDELLDRVASELSIHLKPPPSISEKIWEFHKNRELLLILDNVEQVDRNALTRLITGLYGAGSSVKFLLTSTRQTDLRSERVAVLLPLNEVEAVAMFVDRAQSADVTYAPNDLEISAIRELCGILEGVPLAIEISATLTSVMSAKQIVSQFRTQLAAVSSERPDVPERHQKLLTAIQYTVNTLPETIRNLFADVSVFAGSFRIEAATAIFGPSAITGVMTLLKHSLLVASVTEDGIDGGSKRLRMLNAVRSYGQELQTDPSVRRKHAQYYADWNEALCFKLESSDVVEALTAIELEFDNTRWAIEWAKVQDGALWTKLLLGLLPAFDLRGPWNEAESKLTEAIEARKSGGDPTTMAWLLFWRASMRQYLDQVRLAQADVELAASLFQAAGDLSGNAAALNLQCVMATECNEYGQAKSIGQMALGLWPDSNLVGRAKTLHNLSRIAYLEDDVAEARAFIDEAQRLRAKAADIRGEAYGWNHYGAIMEKLGERNEAKSYYFRSLDAVRSLREPFLQAICLNNIAECCAAEPDYRNAVLLFMHAERQFRDIGASLHTYSRDELRKLLAQLGQDEYDRIWKLVRDEPWEPAIEVMRLRRS